MKTEHEIDLLNRIERVEPPSDLYERIHDRIHALRRDKISMKWTLAASIVFALMVSVNAYLLTSGSGKDNSARSDAEILTTELQMSQSNQLYHD